MTATTAERPLSVLAGAMLNGTCARESKGRVDKGLTPHKYVYTLPKSRRVGQDQPPRGSVHLVAALDLDATDFATIGRPDLGCRRYLKAEVCLTLSAVAAKRENACRKENLASERGPCSDHTSLMTQSSSRHVVCSSHYISLCRRAIIDTFRGITVSLC